MDEILKVDTLGPHKCLFIMVGLPYSGKSSFAKAMGCPIVNADSIRVALHGRKFFPNAEPMVWAAAKTMVRSLFLAGNDIVILDATSLSYEKRAEWQSPDWTVQLINITTPKETCIQRAINAGDDSMVPIIERMALYYEKPEAPENVFYEISLETKEDFILVGSVTGMI